MGFILDLSRLPAALPRVRHLIKELVACTGVVAS
jgi:hypothetical protein